MRYLVILLILCSCVSTNQVPKRKCKKVVEINNSLIDEFSKQKTIWYGPQIITHKVKNGKENFKSRPDNRFVVLMKYTNIDFYDKESSELFVFDFDKMEELKLWIEENCEGCGLNANSITIMEYENILNQLK